MLYFRSLNMDQEEKEKNQREAKEENLLPTASPNGNTPPNNENGIFLFFFLVCVACCSVTCAILKHVSDWHGVPFWKMCILEKCFRLAQCKLTSYRSRMLNVRSWSIKICEKKPKVRPSYICLFVFQYRCRGYFKCNEFKKRQRLCVFLCLNERNISLVAICAVI